MSMFFVFSHNFFPIANTFCMRKYTLHTLSSLFLALFLFTSCQSVAPNRDPSFSSDGSFPLVENSTPNADLTPELTPDPEQIPVPLPEPPPATNGAFWDVSDVDVSAIDPNRKLISFTFDDAPSRTIEPILAVFAAFNEENPDCPATATFFFNGKYFDSNTPHTLHAARALGMELGNHSYSHFDLTTLSETQLKDEIDRTDALLQKIDGKKHHLFRAPFGRINELVRSAVHTPILDWTIDTLDWTGATEEDIYHKIWTQKFSGAIVLMHDGYEPTVDALKRLLPDLKAAGYQVASVSAMAKAHACPLRNGGVYIRARKNGVG